LPHPTHIFAGYIFNSSLILTERSVFFLPQFHLIFPVDSIFRAQSIFPNVDFNFDDIGKKLIFSWLVSHWTCQRENWVKLRKKT